MISRDSKDPTTIRRLYGRRQGHALRGQQVDLIEKLLPQIAVPVEGDVSSATLFGNDRPLHFEIGFGAGEHLAARADMLPDHGFIGCEPYLNGVVGALQHIRDGALLQRPPTYGQCSGCVGAYSRWRA